MSQSWDFADGDDATDHHVNQDVTPFRLFVCMLVSRVYLLFMRQLLLLLKFFLSSRSYVIFNSFSLHYLSDPLLPIYYLA